MNTETFEFFLKNVKESFHPILDEDLTNIVSNPRFIDFIEQFWDEAKDIGYSIGYDDGLDDAMSNYYADEADA